MLGTSLYTGGGIQYSTSRVELHSLVLLWTDVSPHLLFRQRPMSIQYLKLVRPILDHTLHCLTYIVTSNAIIFVCIVSREYEWCNVVRLWLHIKLFCPRQTDLSAALDNKKSGSRSWSGFRNPGSTPWSESAPKSNRFLLWPRPTPSKNFIKIRT